jgi:hypothetical protein
MYLKLIALMAAITAIACGSVGARAQSAMASPPGAALPVGQVRGAALSKLVSGSTMSTTSAFDNKFTLSFYSDGKLDGVIFTYGGRPSENGHGTWNLKGDQICIEIAWDHGPTSLCRSITWDGKNFIESVYGHVATFSRKR